MLAALRNQASGVFIKILLLLLVLSFGAWGIADVFSPGRPTPVVATVGDRNIGNQAVANEIQREVQGLREILGDLEKDQVRALGIPRSVLNRMVDRTLFDQGAKDLGLVVSDAMARQEIESNKAFYNQINRFDRFIFQQVLQQNGLNETAYVADLRAGIARRQLFSAIRLPVTPETLTQTLYRHYQETRIADIVIIENKDVTTPVLPDEAALRAFHQDNAARFTAPEYRALTAVILRARDIASEIAVEDEKLKALYAEREAEFVKPETRELQQILASSEDAAKKALGLIQSGMNFAAAAKEAANMDEKAIDLGVLSKGELLSDLAEPVFALAEGAVSAPLKSALGWHLVKVTKITPEARQTFSDVKDLIKKEIQADRAIDAIYDLSNRLEDALGGGATLEEAAGQIGVRADHILSVDETGRDAQGQPVMAALENDIFLQSAFALGEGQDSVLNETEQGYFIVRVDTVTPPALKPFEAVRADVESAWKKEAEGKLAETTADGIIKKLESGGDLATLAREHGLTMKPTAPFTRTGKGLSDVALPNDLIGQLFTLQPGGVGTGMSGQGVVVARLKSIETANPAQDADGMKALGSELAKSIEGDLLTQLAAGLTIRHPVDVNASALDQLY